MAKRPGRPWNLRQEAGQLSWTLRAYGGPRRMILQYRINRSLSPLKLPKKPVVPGSAWGVTFVRNEEDLIRGVLQHHLDQGLAGIIVADNGSTDGTWNILTEVAEANDRVHICRDTWPRFDQSEKVSRLAYLAWRAGADWIVPFDGDEFWFANGVSLAEHLTTVRREDPDTTLFFADWHTMLPLSDDLMGGDWIVDSSPLPPGKVAVRTHPLLKIEQGNHSAVRVGGHRKGGVYVAHAMYRSPQQIARKLRLGAAASAASVHGIAPHWDLGSKMTDDEIAAAWVHIISGGADPRLSITAEGPMVIARPPTWKTWDPDGQLR